MRDSQTWWDETKNNERLLVDWLMNQYHGEATAAIRIREFIDKFATKNSYHFFLLENIARQEEDHAKWVGSLLEARGVSAQLLLKTDRYWTETLPQITSFETGTAVAAKAEAMRLERIRTICWDDESPADVRSVFLRILPQEVQHEKTFRHLTTTAALNAVNPGHLAGLEALGLML